MSECTDCSKARINTWAGYTRGCPSCTARAIARSLAAFNALSAKGSGDRKPLSESVDKLMGGMDRDEAVKMVRGWYRVDHDLALVAQEVGK